MYIQSTTLYNMYIQSTKPHHTTQRHTVPHHITPVELQSLGSALWRVNSCHAVEHTSSIIYSIIPNHTCVYKQKNTAPTCVYIQYNPTSYMCIYTRYNTTSYSTYIHSTIRNYTKYHLYNTPPYTTHHTIHRIPHHTQDTTPYAEYPTIHRIPHHTQGSSLRPLNCLRTRRLVLCANFIIKLI